MISKKRILLVEDNQDDYEVFYRSINSGDRSFSVEWFQYGQDALCYVNKIIEEEKYKDLPNLIILDLNLPGIDGREILKILKPICLSHSIPIIILTTSNDYKDVLKCYQYGASSYIQKPIDLNRFKNICKVLTDYWFDTVIIPQNSEENLRYLNLAESSGI